MFRTLSLLFLLATPSVIFSKMKKLHVNFTSQYPVVRVRVQDCKDNGKMKLEIRPCNSSRMQWIKWKAAFCEKEGGKVCIRASFRNEDCAVIKGRMDGEEYQSSVFSLANMTFYNPAHKKNISTSTWLQQGNTSVLRLQPVVGVPVYKLKLEPDGRNKSEKCKEHFLTGNTEESSPAVVFTAHWGKVLFPGCTYRTWFVPKDSCDSNLIMTHSVELEVLEYTTPGDEVTVFEPSETRIYAAAAGTLAFLFLLLLSITLHQIRVSRRNTPSKKPSGTALMKCEVPASPETTILLVYTTNLQTQMADLATRLKNLTGLQIEDLHDVGDQDKLNDPTVWLTRRLMDPNTRFVLACSSLHYEEESSEELQNRGVVYFLLDHFLQYLHSSSLAYDYTRLHMVRFEGQAHVESDCTPGRVYQLPAHLTQLSRNLTSATPHPTTSKECNTLA